MLVALTAIPAGADDNDNFVDFVAEQADAKRGQFNIIGNVVLALAGSGDLSGDDVAALSSAEITAFLPTDLGFRRLAADLQGKSWWQVKERDVIPFLVDTLTLPTIAEVVKYHIFAGGQVDYRTALSLDDNRRNGTDVFIEMYNGGELGIDRRARWLQLDDAGAAGFGTNNPWVVRPNINGGNAVVHGISEVLLP
jgi:hypothetical protein